MKNLYSTPKGETRWASFENPSAGKGIAGHENHKAKGSAFGIIASGASVDLVNYKGAGTVTRIWMTIKDRSPTMLRSLVIRCYWDNAKKPAVEAPIGDFFASGSRLCTFENELFSSPEGRSFNSFVPMPFKKAAKITITNESDMDFLHIFYDVNMLILDEPDEDALYFHCYWNRVKRTTLGEDYNVLPKINGKGRILGTSFEVIPNPVYKNYWWGEGEVKVYLDDDNELPTLCGTGTEDYIGSAWEQGVYYNRYQGCLSAGGVEQEHKWIFYRLHITDPIYFHRNVKFDIQTMGGAMFDNVKQMIENNVPLIPVSCALEDRFIPLYKKEMELPNEGWINYYRSDDFSSVTWFYLDKCENELPPILPVNERV